MMLDSHTEYAVDSLKLTAYPYDIQCAAYAVAFSVQHYSRHHVDEFTVGIDCWHQCTWYCHNICSILDAKISSEFHESNS